MKVEDVPQDLKYTDGYIVRDIAYAVDSDGHYTSVVSDGWNVKSEALDLTMDEIREKCDEIKQRIEAGTASSLEYYAAKNIMDISLLSRYTGIPKWKIRRHFKQKFFSRLDNETLAKYADALRITVDTLTSKPE
ncbi:MAG: helix-turn-helix domain-containing protein [Salinivirgaceae bacterium]|nr:helix-turn-helix domain-containing protein [Salinivirgaceae bacterium]